MSAVGPSIPRGRRPLYAMALTRAIQGHPIISANKPEGTFGRFESRLPLRSSNRHEDVLPLPLSRQSRVHVGLRNRPRL
jgi:hypothetical protein